MATSMFNQYGNINPQASGMRYQPGKSPSELAEAKRKAQLEAQIAATKNTEQIRMGGNAQSSGQFAKQWKPVSTQSTQAVPQAPAPVISGGAQGGDWLNNLFSGAGGAMNKASSNTNELLNGNASASATRSANAMFGAGAGQAGSGDASSFIGQRGADLYGAQSQAMKQQGLQDLLGTIGATASPYTALRGQDIGQNQFAQNLGFQNQQLNQQDSQFNQNLGFQNKQLGQQQGQFDATQQQAMEQFLRNADLNQQQINNQAGQFGQTIGFNRDQFNNLSAAQQAQLALQQQQMMQQGSQFNKTFGLNEFQAQLQALGLLGGIAGQSQQNPF